jgi:hypothetical protein
MHRFCSAKGVGNQTKHRHDVTNLECTGQSGDQYKTKKKHTHKVGVKNIGGMKKRYPPAILQVAKRTAKLEQ